MAKKRAPGKTKGGNKKHGRDKTQCERYRAAGIREKNKARKHRKHIKRHPNDIAK